MRGVMHVARDVGLTGIGVARALWHQTAKVVVRVAFGVRREGTWGADKEAGRRGRDGGNASSCAEWSSRGRKWPASIRSDQPKNAERQENIDAQDPRHSGKAAERGLCLGE